MFQNEPIFRQLTAERGDVPAQARATAEETLRQLRHVMDWSGPIPNWPDRTRHAGDTPVIAGRPTWNPEHGPPHSEPLT